MNTGVGSIYAELTTEQRALLRTEAGCCDICKTVNIPLAIDHDHDTGLVRGVICRNCNLGIIYNLERGSKLNISEELRVRAINYLDFSSWQTNITIQKKGLAVAPKTVQKQLEA